MQRLTTFLRKPRNFMIVAVTSAGVVLGLKAAPHLFPNKLFRPIFEAYKTGKCYSITEAQQQEFLDVCRDLNVDPSKYNTFVTSRWEVKTKGFPWLPSGCHFGIPATMVTDPELSNLRFSGPIKANLDTREGMWLKDSLKLSEKARKFAMGQRVALVDNNLALYSILLAPVCTLAGFVTTFVVQIFSPFVPVYGTGLIVGTCFFFTYRFLMGGINKRLDLKANRRVGNVSEDYTMGGLEFYEKHLQKNRALRKLLGSKGEQLYTYYGNEMPGFVYSSGAPNIQKRDILKEMVEKIEENRKRNKDETKQS